jgi:hypothetical protein
MTTFEELFLKMWRYNLIQEAPKTDSEIKMDEFQDFFERHFEKDNFEQQKEIFDIVS